MLARNLIFIITSLLLTFGFQHYVFAQHELEFDRQSEWNGFQQFHFEVDGQAAYVVAPKKTSPEKTWVWRARFPNYHAEMDIELLKRGFHIGYVDVAGMFGGPRSIEIGNQFYQFMTEQVGLAKQPAMEGVSRGGLFVYNWTASNPEKVSCIYCDTPVCDFRSWPGGKGTGRGAPNEWQQCLNAYGISEAESETYIGNPIDHSKIIAEAKIPTLHIVSENDQIVPPTENTYVLRDRLKELGCEMEVISVAQGTEKSSGHHFDHPEVERVVRFIKLHATAAARMDLLIRSDRVVFLGDSITYSGTYIVGFEQWLWNQSQDGKHLPTVINMGLPSETVSGLSEEGHAGGNFPRPDLNERLTRVLDLTKPNLVIACYGINCGIYQPFGEERFQAYQKGIENLKSQVEAIDATLILVTPPIYDDEQGKRGKFSYNAVMTNYSKWLVTKRDEGWLVVDLHSAMHADLLKRRKDDPNFTFQPDSVHPDSEGHRLIASVLANWFEGIESTTNQYTDTTRSTANVETLQSRMTVLRDAYIHAAGHKRPGIRQGKPIDEALKHADELTKQLKR